MAKDSVIYRRAAEVTITDNRFYGFALDEAGQPLPGGSDSPLQDEITDLFAGLYENWMDERDPRAYEIQALALCLMADIVASDGR
jgi:hypothetical protein